jgi:hypothetical protein
MMTIKKPCETYSVQFTLYKRKGDDSFALFDPLTTTVLVYEELYVVDDFMSRRQSSIPK